MKPDIHGIVYRDTANQRMGGTVSGTLCHYEIFTKNLQRAEKFYTDLFGWKFDRNIGDEYLMFSTVDGTGGAIAKVDNFVPSIGLYFEVDSCDKFMLKANSLGASTQKEKTEIPGHGWYSVFKDPDGNSIGLFQRLAK